jgi:hypothetical protein
VSTLNKKAKVTPETTAEAAALRRIWDSTEHASQAAFGEIYDIGNQSAVGQFLRGEVPLSLKAAQGFAKGLNCKIEDFSPRLAASLIEARYYAVAEQPAPEIAELANVVEKLTTSGKMQLTEVSAMIAMLKAREERS